MPSWQLSTCSALYEQFNTKIVSAVLVASLVVGEAAALLAPRLLAPLLLAAAAALLAVSEEPGDETGHRGGAEGFHGD